MAIRRFIVKDYTIRQGGKLSATFGGMRVEARGIISSIGPDNQRIVAYFLADDSPVPAPITTHGGKQGSVFLPREMMGEWVDLLRYEKPLFGYINTDHPESTFISTCREPVGEGREYSISRAEQNVFWTWQEPLAEAADLENIHWMIRPNMIGGGKETADWVSDKILQRGLHEGEIGICLQNFGIGQGDPDWKIRFQNSPTPLYMHWGDALPERERSEGFDWWRTPWFSTGVAVTQAWMNKFIAQYKARQNIDGIPDPSRFIFDTEPRFEALYNGEWVKVFPKLQRDERYQTENLLGFNATLADLFTQAGITFNSDEDGWHPENNDFMNWWQGVTLTIIEAGLNEVAYHPIREAWPAAMSSNYRTSAKIDGQGDPPRLEGTLLPHATHPWIAYSWRQFGNLQAPEFYWTNQQDENLLGLETQDALVWVINHKMPWYIASYGLNDPVTITPWIYAIGECSSAGQKQRELTHTPEWARAQIEALREWGIKEFLVHSGISSQRESYWCEFAKIACQINDSRFR